MKKVVAFLLTLSLAFSVVACSKEGDQNTKPENQQTEDVQGVESTEPEKIVVTDSYGNEVAVDKELEKIVVFNSSLCTVLDAFGKSDTIVGAYDSLAEKYAVPNCGSWNDVDVEAVIATGAEAVFSYQSYVDETKLAQLQNAGVTCVFIELSNADQVADEIASIGTLFGCEEKADVFVNLYHKYDDLLTERLADAEGVPVYVEGTASEYKTANSTTAAHKLVTGAGGINIAADNETSYPARELEWVIEQNPTAVIKLWGSTSVLSDELYKEYVSGLPGVEAADNHKVLMLSNDVGTTATGSIIGRLYIAKFLYPEKFEDIDVDAVYQELCEGFLGTEYTGSGAYFVAE